MQDFDFAQT